MPIREGWIVLLSKLKMGMRAAPEKNIFPGGQLMHSAPGRVFTPFSNHQKLR